MEESKSDFDSYCVQYMRSHDRAIARASIREMARTAAANRRKATGPEQGPRGGLAGLLVDGRVEDPLDGLVPLARIDAIYAAMDRLCGFIDMTGPWWRYIQQSGKDLTNGFPALTACMPTTAASRSSVGSWKVFQSLKNLRSGVTQ